MDDATIYLIFGILVMVTLLCTSVGLVTTCIPIVIRLATGRVGIPIVLFIFGMLGIIVDVRFVFGSGHFELPSELSQAYYVMFSSWPNLWNVSVHWLEFLGIWSAWLVLTPIGLTLGSVAAYNISTNTVTSDQQAEERN